MVDALNIISFKNKLKHIRETRMGFIWIPAKPYEPHLWLITVEATQVKNQVKKLSLTYVGSVQGRTGPPGSLAFARWADWPAGQVGRYVKC